MTSALIRNIPRNRCVGNVSRDRGYNDRDEIFFVQLRNLRRVGRSRNPPPPPLPLHVEDEAQDVQSVEGGGFEHKNLDVNQKSIREAPPTSGDMDRIGQAIQTVANLMEKRKKNRDASLQTVHGVKVPLSKFLKLTPPTFKGVDDSDDPQ